MSSPPFGSPAYKRLNIGWQLATIDLVTISVAFILVLGRLYTKYFITKSPGWEDFCSVIALLLAISRTVGDCLGVFRYGLGRHFSTLPESDYNPLVILVYTDGLLYVVSVTFAKMAILFFLYRIFKVVPKFRYTSWAISAIMILWASITVLIALFSCRPLGAPFNYKLLLANYTRCINYPQAENVFGFCNILVDFVLLIMPMPLLWTLHMTNAKKIGVSIIFANGAVICAIAIVRQYMLYTAGPQNDLSWQLIRIKKWMIIEVNLAIICGCLPVLQPLFRKLPLLVPFIPSHLRSLFSGGHSAMERASWPKRLTGPRHRHAASDDVEQGNGVTRKAPWREPGELSSRSGESSLSRYHSQQQLHQQGQDFVVPSAFDSEPENEKMEQVALRMERLGRDEKSRGFAV